MPPRGSCRHQHDSSIIVTFITAGTANARGAREYQRETPVAQITASWGRAGAHGGWKTLAVRGGRAGREGGKGGKGSIWEGRKRGKGAKGGKGGRGREGGKGKHLRNVRGVYGDSKRLGSGRRGRV